MDFKRPRKLNLNAPILSTRRFGSAVVDTSCSSSSLCTFQNTSERVPFSWETEAGKPKDMGSGSSTTTARDGGTPRLKLPPCHPNDVDNGDDLAFNDGDDDGCDDNKDDLFSDTMDDVFSLSEALDIVQKKSEKAHSGDNYNNDGLKLKLAESNGYQSPTYMINRFLPDATALAASSASQFPSSDLEDKVCDTCSYPECFLSSGSVAAARYSSCASSSPKGCGLELLFPWRMKHKFCALDTPVLPCSMNLPKPRRSLKPKKHRSSAYIPCTNVKKDI